MAVPRAFGVDLAGPAHLVPFLRSRRPLAGLSRPDPPIHEAMTDWGEVFSPSAHILETFVRGSVMYLVIFMLMRIAGQREGGVHSLSDLLVIVLVAQAASTGMVGDTSGIMDSVVLIATILFWSVAVDAAAFRWPALRRVLASKPSPLIRDGVINERALRREFMDHDELMGELRLHGIDDVRKVSRAYLETNGMVSVIRRADDDDDDDGDARNDAKPPPSIV